MFRVSSITTDLSLVIILLALAGCSGEEGPERFDVSGTVSFDGSPAPAGSIVFSPDTAQGNSGPQGAATIIDGQYNTADDGRGIVGGPHTVRIIVTESNSESQDAELAGPLVEYSMENDFPKESSEFNIDVPAEN